MTEPIIPVADELTEASKYAEVVDPLNSLENPEFLTAEELVRVMHPVFDEQIIWRCTSHRIRRTSSSATRILRTR